MRVQEPLPLDSPLPLDAPPIRNVTPPQPVGYEHVYRFELAEVEEIPAVVPRAGPVCPHCGKIHVAGDPLDHDVTGSSKVVQTAATSRAAPSAAPKPTPKPTPKPMTGTSGARSDGHRSSNTSNRNAARGSNRHVRASNQRDSDRPVWDVDLPSFQRHNATQNSDRQTSDNPSMLHRMSSTLKHLGSSSVQ